MVLDSFLIWIGGTARLLLVMPSCLPETASTIPGYGAKLAEDRKFGNDKQAVC